MADLELHHVAGKVARKRVGRRNEGEAMRAGPAQPPVERREV